VPVPHKAFPLQLSPCPTSGEWACGRVESKNHVNIRSRTYTWITTEQLGTILATNRRNKHGKTKEESSITPRIPSLLSRIRLGHALHDPACLLVAWSAGYTLPSYPLHQYLRFTWQCSAHMDTNSIQLTETCMIHTYLELRYAENQNSVYFYFHCITLLLPCTIEVSIVPYTNHTCCS
jgi:hypothetical protein